MTTTTTTTTESPTMTTTTMTATEAYVAAAAAAEVADDAYDAATCSEACAATPGDHLPGCPEGAALAARHAAHAAHDAAQEAWRVSDEPRDWEVHDDQAQDTLHDVAPDDIADAIEEWLTDGDWDPSEGPLYLTAYACPIDPTTGTADGAHRVTAEVTIEQDAPDCEGDEEHDWCAPHSVVGGLRENPGVYGAGAGITSRRVCSHCGAYTVYESARQDSGTGRYHEATSYEEPDDDSLEWVASRRREARTEQLVAALTDACEDEDALREAIGAALDADEDATEDDVRARLDEDEDEDEDVVCECGDWCGEACAWTGPQADTVLVEYMPEQHRASHEAAGNRGSYPSNGAQRIRVSRECAANMIRHDGEWCEIRREVAA